MDRTARSGYCLPFLPLPCLTSIEWAAWLQAIGAVVGIAVAIYLARSGERRARKLLEADRARQAGIAQHLIAGRASELQDEAEAKAAWLRGGGAPRDLAHPSREVRAAAAERLRLASADAFASDVRTAGPHLDTLPGIRVSGTLNAAQDHNRLISTMLDTFDIEPFAPHFRQHMTARLTQSLDLVAASAGALSHYLVPREAR
ncbi:hypothetical protein [Luteimonas changyuni]|uniref:hypothetical protein n=1 Tax=Luteimonas sp. MJ145 TaxID=3129234 RepID=UPI0031BACEC5